MTSNVMIRKWATPLTIGAFALSAISGVMIFFHLNFGFVKVAHQWGSWFLVIGGLFHVIGSWHSFTGYFFRPLGRTIITMFVLLIIASLLPLGGQAESRKIRKLPPAVLSKAFPQASFSTMAGIAQHDPEELARELGMKGVIIKNKEETIHDIAVINNKQDVEILNLVF